MEGKEHFYGEGILRPRLIELAAHGSQQLVAGLQADAVALHPAFGGVDAVADGDDQLVLVDMLADGDGVIGIGIFSDIGKEIIEDPAEVNQIHPEPALELAAAGLHLEVMLM